MLAAVAFAMLVVSTLVWDRSIAGSDYATEDEGHLEDNRAAV